MATAPTNTAADNRFTARGVSRGPRRALERLATRMPVSDNRGGVTSGGQRSLSRWAIIGAG